MMSKLLTAAAVSGALMLPALAGAQSFPDPTGYGNRGQCEAAVSRARNEVRQDTTAGDTDRNDGKARSEVNQQARQDWQCVEEAGRWYVRTPTDTPTTTDPVTTEPAAPEPSTTKPPTPEPTPPAPQSPPTPPTAPPQ
jgi:hypothetical protein